MKLIAVFATAAFASDAVLNRDDANRFDDNNDVTFVDGNIINHGNDGSKSCLKCENAASVASCNDGTPASVDICEGNEDVCWFRITYEADGTEKTVNAGCKSSQACKDAQGQNRDVQNAQSNNCRGDQAAANWGNSRIIGPEAVCNYCVKRDNDVTNVVGFLNTAIAGTADGDLTVHHNQPGEGGAFGAK